MFANFKYSLSNVDQTNIQCFLRTLPETAQDHPIWELLHDLTYMVDWTETPAHEVRTPAKRDGTVGRRDPRGKDAEQEQMKSQMNKGNWYKLGVAHVLQTEDREYNIEPDRYYPCFHAYCRGDADVLRIGIFANVDRAKEHCLGYEMMVSGFRPMSSTAFHRKDSEP